MNNKVRKLDLSVKFLQMGQALQQEGEEIEDDDIAMLGTLLIFVGSLALNDRDLNQFADIVEMFTAKKTFDNLARTQPKIMALINGVADGYSYDDLINRLKNNKEREENNEDEENIDE